MPSLILVEKIGINLYSAIHHLDACATDHEDGTQKEISLESQSVSNTSFTATVIGPAVIVKLQQDTNELL